MTDPFPYPDLKISLGPRPGKKSAPRLRERGLTHCVSLLSEREDPHLIERLCKSLGSAEQPCQWVWLTVDGGNLEVLKTTDVIPLVQHLAETLTNTPDPHVYIHCSAGLHRTGFFAYLLLRLMGREKADALEELASIRQVTADQVGSERVDLADEILAAL